MKKYVILFFISFLVASGFAQNQKNEPIFSGSYFGQKEPGNSPEVFIPELFNKYGYLHGRLVFAPGGKEVFWVITTSDKGENFDKRLFIKQKPDGTWSEPEESFLSIDRKENGPSYSIDGKRLYYQSRSPLNGDGKNKGIDIWYRERNDDEWSEPVNIGAPVNTSQDESQPFVTSDGSIFFCRNNEKTNAEDKGGSDIYFAEFKNGKYEEPICLGPEINSGYQETEPAFAPDGGYLLFISNRPGGYSRMMNLYVSFRKPEGGWTKAICLSKDLKIDNIWFPTITYDGKYLFFCGGYPTEHGYNNSNYYWVSINFFEN